MPQSKVVTTMINRRTTMTQTTMVCPHLGKMQLSKVLTFSIQKFFRFSQSFLPLLDKNACRFFTTASQYQESTSCCCKNQESTFPFWFKDVPVRVPFSLVFVVFFFPREKVATCHGCSCHLAASLLHVLPSSFSMSLLVLLFNIVLCSLWPSALQPMTVDLLLVAQTLL